MVMKLFKIYFLTIIISFSLTIFTSAQEPNSSAKSAPEKNLDSKDPQIKAALQEQFKEIEKRAIAQIGILQLIVINCKNQLRSLIGNFDVYSTIEKKIPGDEKNQKALGKGTFVSNIEIVELEPVIKPIELKELNKQLTFKQFNFQVTSNSETKKYSVEAEPGVGCILVWQDEKAKLAKAGLPGNYNRIKLLSSGENKNEFFVSNIFHDGTDSSSWQLTEQEKDIPPENIYYLIASQEDKEK